MELRLPTHEELKFAYERDMVPAFPRAELKPLNAIEGLYGKGVYRPYLLWEKGELVGEAFVWAFEPGWTLFEYLCVSETHRNRDLGSELIGKLTAAEQDNVLFGECEIPQYAEDPALAARRLDFYRRNGARRAGYDTVLFGVPFHTLYWAKEAVADEAMITAHQKVYCEHFGQERYQKYFCIPWDCSMGMPKKIPWEE